MKTEDFEIEPIKPISTRTIHVPLQYQGKAPVPDFIDDRPAESEDAEERAYNAGFVESSRICGKEITQLRAELAKDSDCPSCDKPVKSEMCVPLCLECQVAYDAEEKRKRDQRFDCGPDGCDECAVCEYLSWLEWAQSVAPPDSTIQRNKAIEAYLKLRAELDSKDKWRLALESFTLNGSEFVNDLDRCVAYVRERLSEGHEAKKDVVRLRRELAEKEVKVEAYDWIQDEVLKHQPFPTDPAPTANWVRCIISEAMRSREELAKYRELLEAAKDMIAVLATPLNPTDSKSLSKLAAWDCRMRLIRAVHDIEAIKK